MPAAIRVLLVEDEELLRDALVAALDSKPGITIAAAVADMQAARSWLEKDEADVAVIDFVLPDGYGTDLATPARMRRLLITGTHEGRAVRAALSAGFEGFVAKGSGLADLARAVRVVHGGGALFPADLLPIAVTGRRPIPTLTEREAEVLQELADAQPLTEIAKTHDLSIHTVRNHVRSILEKLDAHSQLEAVVVAARAGLVDL